MRQDTILRYAHARIPRYTSYPTAPHFGPEVNAAVYARWLGELDPAKPVSLYLHVPFCRTMCWYCGCHTKATRRIDPVDAYAEVLLREIDSVAARCPERLKVSHIHWGGGSPTYLPPERFAELMARIRERFNVLEDAEIAVEVDPRIFSDAMATAFARSGVNRASLGVQTFDEIVQKAVNRIQSVDLVADCLARLRAVGIEAVNLDLLYGLPLQTEVSCRQTVAQILDFAPDRLSVFGYAHVPHMKPHQKMIKDPDLPDARERLAQSDAIAEELTKASYVQIGLDHFARAGDPLAMALDARTLRRNFQGYTTDTANAIIGLGSSAIGWLPQGYVQNTPMTHDWERRVLESWLPIARGYELTPEDRMRRDIIEQLMCFLSVDLEAVSNAHAILVEMPDLSGFEAEGIVSVDGLRITIAPDYRPLARSVAAAFDRRLATSTARHAVAV
ncbi:oxygen-independent coproporphyrinogen III oxidase [Marinicauda pacifica]|uniref:Coproporphyrinogen-III oxidase n=1 Tax=Marinicauda pacifica TaxID=1133559 RepID=A0A4V3RYZ0_9PROT|nr:oxygen-independent coproporphyrinogen III oxidase [Marinicauda pacifica]TGY92249.1 oxygen-independent coproporphyrinogen III oxidase [Marinicauda pacifica]GGE47302.1 oxygen-independent coproporphyrinogen III oxidase [Marinicauda pacifica]